MNADKIMREVRKSLNTQLKAGETYRSIGDAAGVPHSQIWHIVKGRTQRGRTDYQVDPRISTVAALVNYLGVTVE